MAGYLHVTRTPLKQLWRKPRKISRGTTSPWGHWLKLNSPVKKLQDLKHPKLLMLLLKTIVISPTNKCDRISLLPYKYDTVLPPYKYDVSSNTNFSLSWRECCTVLICTNSPLITPTVRNCASFSPVIFLVGWTQSDHGENSWGLRTRPEHAFSRCRLLIFVYIKKKIKLKNAQNASNRLHVTSNQYS